MGSHPRQPIEELEAPLDETLDYSIKQPATAKKAKR